MCSSPRFSSRQELISRINESKKLNEDYQAHFHKTKAKLQESANERQWNFRCAFVRQNLRVLYHVRLVSFLF